MTALHADWCSQPEPRLDAQGVIRCPSCKWIAPLPKRPVQLVSSSYRCREHSEQAVTYRGTGCPNCAAQKVKSAASRRAKRAKTTEPTNPTERQNR